MVLGVVVVPGSRGLVSSRVDVEGRIVVSVLVVVLVLGVVAVLGHPVLLPVVVVLGIVYTNTLRWRESAFNHYQCPGYALNHYQYPGSLVAISDDCRFDTAESRDRDEAPHPQCIRGRRVARRHPSIPLETHHPPPIFTTSVAGA